MSKKIFLYLSIFLFLALAGSASAHQPNVIYLQKGDISITNPEISRAFYDELKGRPRDYYIYFPAQGGPASGWELYLNLLVPDPANRDGRYSADVFDSTGQKIYSLDGSSGAPSGSWQPYYEPFGRDYYLKGPELDKNVPAGKYKIEVYSADPSTGSGQANLGKYVLAIGKVESFDIQSVLNIYWQLPLLKLTFFKTSLLQFFLTPFGIGLIGAVGGLLILLALIGYFVALVKEIIKHNEAKTLLLTSAGMQMRDEIIKLLQKPAYDVTVGFITTAYKYKLEENPDYVNRDLQIMTEMGFNIEEIDIEGKKEAQVLKLLELKDITFVEGGNTFYLLKAMRECNFERVIRKVLKQGKVYIGVSAGSIVAGRTIKTAGWKDADKNIVHLKNLKGLNLVPFDIFVHYTPEHAEIIKQEIPNAKKRAKNLRILTNDQALLVQGKEIDLIGQGEQITV
jgi:peptidase E